MKVSWDEKERVSEIGRFLGPRLNSLSLAIWLYAEDHHALRPVGTGALLEAKEKLFLVTAHHVVASKHENDVICVSRGLGVSNPVKLVVAVVRFFSDWDISVIEIPEWVKPLLQPMPRSSIDVIGELDGGLHLIVGWPAQLRPTHALSTGSESVATIVADAVSLRLWDYRGDREGLAGVQDEHLLLELDPACLSGGRLPALEGISGAPVWRVHDDSSLLVRPALVGVQTGFHPMRNGTTVVRASPASLVLELLG